MPGFGSDRAVRLPDTAQLDRVAHNQAGIITDDPSRGTQLLDDKAVGQKFNDAGVMHQLHSPANTVRRWALTVGWFQHAWLKEAINN
jgi:hypothetical protein